MPSVTTRLRGLMSMRVFGIEASSESYSRAVRAHPLQHAQGLRPILAMLPTRTRRGGLAVADADAEVLRAEARQRVLVGHVVAGEQHGRRAEARAQRGESGVLALVPERVLDDVVPGAPAPVRRARRDEPVGGIARELRRLRRGHAGVDAEPEGLRLDPDALEVAELRGHLVAQLVAQRVRRIVVVGLEHALTGHPELRAVRARQVDRRVVGVLGDLAQVVQAAPGHVGDGGVRKRRERGDRGGGIRQRPRVHGLVLERRERAVEVERDEQSIGCRDTSECHRSCALTPRSAAWNWARASRNSRDQSSTSCSSTRRRARASVAPARRESSRPRA